MRYLVFVLLAACGPIQLTPAGDPTPEPNQRVHVEGAWRQLGRVDPPPGVTWVRSLDCHDGEGFLATDGDTILCLGGAYLPGDSFVRLARPASAPGWEHLCHEFNHVSLWRDGIEDEGHAHASFAPGGRVDHCNEVLARMEAQ